jgi:hypothetical protein
MADMVVFSQIPQRFPGLCKFRSINQFDSGGALRYRMGWMTYKAV